MKRSSLAVAAMAGIAGLASIASAVEIDHGMFDSGYDYRDLIGGRPRSRPSSSIKRKDRKARTRANKAAKRARAKNRK